RARARCRRERTLPRRGVRLPQVDRRAQDRRRDDRVLDRLGRALPHRLHRGRTRRERLAGVAGADRRDRRPGPARGRRPLRDQRGAPATGNRRGRRERDPDQGQPDRDADRDARGDRTRPHQPVPLHHQPPLRRDGGYLHRRPRRRNTERADQDREREPNRPRRQVQPAPPHLGGTRHDRAVPGSQSPVRYRDLILAGVIGAAAYYAVFGGEYSLLEIRRLEAQYEEETERLTALRSEVERLNARADSLANDPVALERIARERYGLIRDGERLYRFVAPEPAAESARR